MLGGQLTSRNRSVVRLPLGGDHGDADGGGGEYHRRHDVRPGITGLAQVNGRTDLTYAEMMAYDLQYVETRSFATDVRIMLKTLGVVLRREGAR